MPILPIKLSEIIKLIIVSVGKGVGKWYSYTLNVGVKLAQEFWRREKLEMKSGVYCAIHLAHL